MKKSPKDIEVTIINRQVSHRINIGSYKTFMVKLLREAGVHADQVSILFTDDRTIRGFNKKYRNKDTVTDVLSFPAGERNAEGNVNVGDIIISVQRAFEQAREARWSLDSEIKKLLIHGFFHCIGYDHEKDSGKMKKLEKVMFHKLAAL